MTLIYHDPFAREELHRRRYYIGPTAKTSCKWCGQVKTTPSHRNFLFLYFTQRTDAAKVVEIPGLFCSVDCMRTYHGG